MLNFEDLKSKVLTSWELDKNDDGNDRLMFLTMDGWKVTLQHYQDCCESVWLEDVAGELDDLIGQPILMAEVVCKDDPNAGDSGTWTFYKLATAKGFVTLRWYGCSNGYYSESVYTDCDFVG